MFIALLVSCAGLHAALPGSPEAYTVYPARHLFNIKKDFLQPSDVAVGRDRQIYVLDGVNNCVKVFDSQGRFLFAFGSKGSRQGEFSNPLGIAADREGRICVADSQNHRVQIFTPAGEWLRTIDSIAPPGGRPADPTDIAIDESKQQMYVVDNDNHHVLVYSLPSYKQIASWASEGERRDQLQYPFFIAAGADSSVFVVDVINTRVQVYSPAGEVVGTIGGWGVDLGQFYRPKGVCVDPDNQIFVSDSYLGVIQVFNRYGNFKYVVGDEEGAVLKWETPVGIAADDRGRLYVVDMIANLVSVYELSGKKIQKP
ncbi:MAG: NHL repeat-containing protein [Deltaproteobacteria bacterium]|nr:NHL repeat-containing protein [Deltaproteobacteria bacterium]